MQERLVEKYKEKIESKGFSIEAQQQANNMLIDIIYDDINYFWTQDYKDIIADKHAEYMADKHVLVTYKKHIDEDLLANPAKSMDRVEAGMNSDNVTKSFSRWV